MDFEAGVASPSKVDLDRVVSAGALLLFFVFAGIWSYAIQNRRFDYDEWEHVHVVWLLSTGLLPFADFFECHPPFLWYPLAGVLRMYGNSYDLLYVFRGLTAAGHLLFFVACGILVAQSEKILGGAIPRFARDFALAVIILAAHPSIFAYLVEFRLDPWPNALLLFAVAYDRRPRTSVLLPSVIFGFFSTAASLTSPKLFALQAIYFVLRILSGADRGRRIAGAAAGAGAAGVLSVLALLVLGYAPREVLRISWEYHRLLNAHGGFGFGLATEVSRQPALLVILVAAIAGWLASSRARIFRAPFELAVLLFLPLQLLLVSFPYKQYVAPWFLLGVCFLLPAARALGRFPRARVVLVAALLLSTAFQLAASARLFLRGHGDAAGAIALVRRFESLVPEGRRVVAPLELRPLFRRDAMYHIATSFAPSGFGTERILETLDMHPMSARFTPQAYAEELEAAAPTLIVLADWYTERQKAAVDDYLERHGGEYRRLEDCSAYVRRSETDSGAPDDRIRR